MKDMPRELWVDKGWYDSHYIAVDSKLVNSTKYIRADLMKETAQQDGVVSLYSFYSTETYRVKGSDTAYVVQAPHEYKRNECPFLNKDVLLNGRLCHVVGVESFCVCPIRKGSSIGLLIRAAEQNIKEESA